MIRDGSGGSNSTTVVTGDHNNFGPTININLSNTTVSDGEKEIELVHDVCSLVANSRLKPKDKKATLNKMISMLERAADKLD